MSTTPIDGDTDRARTLDRATTALEARREGKTWEEVAEAAGFANRGTAYAAVMRYLTRNAEAAAAELRAEANTRHAGVIAMLTDVIYDPDVPLAERLRAVDAHTRAEARHARLNGMDAPVQVAISASVQAELSDALAEVAEVVRLHQGSDGVYGPETQEVV